jgi:hypothetical protein
MTELKLISNDEDKDLYDMMDELALDEKTMEIYQLIYEKIEQKCITIVKAFNAYKPKLKFSEYNIRSEHETRGWGLSSFESGYDSIIINIQRYTGGGNTDYATFVLSNKIFNLSDEQIDEFFKSYDAATEKQKLEKLIKENGTKTTMKI